MSGIFFDLPSLRFLRRFRFFENMMRTFASPLLRWLSAPACDSRQLYFRLNEAEFPAASQSACKLFEWTLRDSRATDCDLFELFNGVGQVQNAEVVSYRHNQRSKGFAFVQMQTIEEAKRAVQELHDKEFLGRRLVVSGAKSSEHQMRS